MSLNDFLHDFGVKELEGNCNDIPAQKNHIASITMNRNVKKVLEIGFNAGHSAEVILSSNPNLHLTSYDINTHSYTMIGKMYIDKKFPGRHTLIYGDSKKMVPKDTGKYDCFFIDGGHDYETAKADLNNCKKLAKPCAMVMFDDVILPATEGISYSLGPTQVWQEAARDSIVTSICEYKYGLTRGMAIGFFSWEDDGVEPPTLTLDL